MFKQLAILITMIMAMNAMASYVPTTIKGQEDAAKSNLVNLQVPNKQATTVGPNTSLLNDCGSSNNLLANCGFEHSTPATGWTLTNGSSAVETSNVKQGRQSLKLTLTAQALDFYQTSTLNATAFADGVNGSISLSAKTTVDNVYLCRTDSAGAVVASTDGTNITNCLKVSNSGKWSDYPLGIILGATSNGMRLVSLTPSTAAAVAVTGDVYVDSGVLEAGLRTQVGAGPVSTARFQTGNARGSTDTATVYFSNTVSTTGDAFTVTSNSVLGTYVTMKKAGTLSVSADIGMVSAGQEMYISKNQAVNTTIPTVGEQIARSIANTAAGYSENLSATIPVVIGDVIRVSTSGAPENLTRNIFLLSLQEGNGSVFSIPSDSFSTDTNTLAHKTTAIASTDPIGTYNTYSYAINTNTKTICGTAPSILPNAADGFKIFTRAYNAASTCGNPARVEIKIGEAGTKFPTIKTDIYKSAAKVMAGSLVNVVLNTNTEAGATYNSYDETTGVLTLDIGVANLGTNTGRNISFNDISAATSGFLVINAQKAKDSIIGSFKEVNTSPGISKPKTCHYAFGGASATLASPTECTTGTCVEVYDSCGTGTPPAYSAGSVYTNFTWGNGTWANSSLIHCDYKAFDVTTGNIRLAYAYFSTGENSWAASSLGGFVTDINTYNNNASSAVDAYVSIKCTGSAP